MKNWKEQYDLIIFDADGTLIDRSSGEYLRPGTIEFFKELHDQEVETAIATQQGGPACRDAGWKNSEKYPTLEFTLDRFDKIERELSTVVYLSLAFHSKAGWIFPEGIHEDDERLKRSWRKPAPGMLLKGMEVAFVLPGRTLMVGDDHVDQEAAAAAGCDFLFPEEFFD